MSDVHVLPIRLHDGSLQHVKRQIETAMESNEGLGTRAFHMAAIAISLGRLTDDLMARIAKLPDESRLPGSLGANLQDKVLKLAAITREIKVLCDDDVDTGSSLATD